MSRELRKSPSALWPPGRDYEAIDCPGWLVPHLQMGRLRPERRGIFPGPHIPWTVAGRTGPGLLPPLPRPPQAVPVRGRGGHGPCPNGLSSLISHHSTLRSPCSYFTSLSAPATIFFNCPGFALLVSIHRLFPPSFHLGKLPSASGDCPDSLGSAASFVSPQAFLHSLSACPLICFPTKTRAP